MGADRSALAVVGVVALLLAALVATTSGGLQPVTISFSPSHHAATQPPQQQGGTSEGGAPGQQQSGTSTQDLGWVSTLSKLLLAGILVALALAIVTGFRLALRRRWKATMRPVATIPEAPPDADEAPPPDLQTLIAAQQVALGAGSPRNAIVAAWVQLEDFAASHGMHRDPADTPAEFVARALEVYHLDHAALERLADLYREARFSTHAVTEDHLAEARECLTRLTRTVAS